MLEDRYLKGRHVYDRLMQELEKYGKLFIAFDFDNTVYDYHVVGDTYPKVEELLRRAKELGHILILFTGNEGVALDKIKEYCKERGYEPDLINENPIMKTRKPYYNILLDDRAGLRDAYAVLKAVLDDSQTTT